MKAAQQLFLQTLPIRNNSLAGMLGVIAVGLFAVIPVAFGVERYDIFETQVTNANSYSNPFDYSTIELQAVFTAPSGRHIDFFGFYDGDGAGGQTGHIWKLRFMPDEAGTWTYTYTWTDGTEGDSGGFDVVDTGRFPGPLRIASDNLWYFEDLRGEPFHFRGYDLPVNAMECPSMPFNTIIDEYEGLVDQHVLPSGYNMVMITAPSVYFDYDTVQGHTWWHYDGSDTDFDRYEILTWNNWDRIIDYYRNNGIYIFPFAVINQGELNNVLDTTERVSRFQRYYVARTAAYWNLLGNSLTCEWPERWSESTVTTWMLDAHNWNPFGTLLSAHDSMRSSFDGWGGFSMRQWQSRTVFDGNTRTANGYVQGSFIDKPIIGSEDIWEEEEGNWGQPRNGMEVRRAAWGEMLAGVMPIYSEWENAPAGGYGNGEGEAEILRMYDFFYSKTSYRQYQMLNSLVSDSARQICSGMPGREYLVYDEDGGSITIDLSSTAARSAFSVLWFDPKTGTEQNDGSVNGGASHTLSSPFTGDSVMLLTEVPHDDYYDAVEDDSIDTPDTAELPEGEDAAAPDVSTDLLPDGSDVVDDDTNEGDGDDGGCGCRMVA